MRFFLYLLGLLAGYMSLVGWSLLAADGNGPALFQWALVALIGLFAVGSALMILIFKSTSLRNKETGEVTQAGTGRAVLMVVKLWFTPVRFLFSFPKKNASYKCPRCGKADGYKSTEVTQHGMTGMVMDNPTGPDFGFVRPVSTSRTVQRCRACNTEMNYFVSRIYDKWVNSWSFVLGIITGLGISIYVDLSALPFTLWI